MSWRIIPFMVAGTAIVGAIAFTAVRYRHPAISEDSSVGRSSQCSPEHHVAATKTADRELKGPRQAASMQRPIEEELAEMGESEGAVYYMSRIREVVGFGNISFGLELFRQMKEQHADSVLLEEAQAVLDNALKEGR